MSICPICGSEYCEQNEDSFFIGKIFFCKTENMRFRIVENIYNNQIINISKLYALIYELISKQDYFGRKVSLVIYYDQKENELGIHNNAINAFYLLKNYPYTIMEKLNRSLLNISYKFKDIGEIIHSDSIYPTMLFCLKDASMKDLEKREIIDMLKDLNFISYPYDKSVSQIKITVDGWKQIESMNKGQTKNVFIAMKFGNDTFEIRNSIKQVLYDLNYNPDLIDEKQHNEQIVPEILHAIEQSRFLIVELSNGNQGAYYEAGVAQGLGKQVIAVCSKDVVENKQVHFDFAQKSLVVYENLDDLKTKLSNRIKATIK
jgi:hypothetical protein